MARRWAAAEVEELTFLVGNVPQHLLPSQFNTWATRHGYAPRTLSSLLNKCQCLRLPLRTYSNWLPVADVVRLCPFSVRVVDRWFDRGWLRCHRRNARGTRRYINRNELQAMARARPLELRGCSYDNLMLLLEDESLALLIAALPSARLNTPKAVRCRDTGQVWPSVAAAARAHWVTHRAITYSIHTGGTAAGRHFEFVFHATP